MKRLFLLPLLALVAGCHAMPTPKDESFIALVSARTFAVCTDQFMFMSSRDMAFCSCLARTVADNTRTAKAFNKKSFKKYNGAIVPTEQQFKDCVAESGQ